MSGPRPQRLGGVEHAARIVLRPIGDPLPLGFLALAGGTLLISGLQLGWLQESDSLDVARRVRLPLQLVASIFGFLARDVVAGTGMGVLAGTTPSDRPFSPSVAAAPEPTPWAETSTSTFCVLSARPGSENSCK